MASAKLVKVHAHHHHHSHISPSRHHGSVAAPRKQSPPPLARVCPSPSAFSRHQQSPAMTLDYSLPRGRDLETASPPQHGLDADLRSYRSPDSDHRDFRKQTSTKGLDLNHRSELSGSDPYRDDADDPCMSPPSQVAEDRDPWSETPTKKNKRKLSSPRRRADISDDESSVKQTKKRKKHSLCPPASPGEDEDSGIDSYKSVEDTILDVVGGAGGPGLAESPSLEKMSMRLDFSSDKRSTGFSKSLLAVPSLSSSSSLPPEKHAHASSKPKSKSRKKSSHSSSNRPPSTSSSRHGGANSDSVPDLDSNKNPSPSPHDPHLQHELPPNFLHPMLATAGVSPAAALGLVPGLYFGQAGLHPSLPVLPPHLQQAYIAAAAAAAAQAAALAPVSAPSSSSLSQSSSSGPSSSSSSTTAAATSQVLYNYVTPSPLPPSLLPSMLYPGVAHRAETNVSESRRRHQPTVSAVEKQPSTKSSAQSSSKLHRQQRQSTSSASSSSPQPQPQQSKSSPSLPEPSTSSFPPGLFHPSSHGSSNTKHTHPIPLPSEPFSGPSTSGLGADPNDSSSSRPQSPEDLSMPGGSGSSRMSRKHRKNYKNMTRERRVEANARERTRVHTISAAFEALRRAVPSYSHNQKLSKLAILRIACSYIMSLARLGDMDYTSASEHIGQPLNFAECVDMTTNTIQTEGRARRRH